MTNIEQQLEILRYDAAVQELLNQLPESRFDFQRFHNETGVSFTDSRFVIIEFEDHPQHPSRISNDTQENEPFLRYAMLRDLVLSQISPVVPAVIGNEHGRLCLIINWTIDPTNWQSACMELLHKVNDALMQNMGFCFQSVVSRLGDGIQCLPRLKQECRDARTYREMFGGLQGEILFYDGIIHTIDKNKDRTVPRIQDIDRNRAFLVSLQEGRWDDAKSIFLQVIDDNFVESRPAVQFVPLRMFSVIDYFLKSLEHASNELNLQTELRTLNAPARLMGLQSVEELKKVTIDLLSELSDQVGDQICRDGLAFQVRAYINQNYTNPEINVSAIAQHFQITPTYATRLFRKQFDIGISDYLLETRLTAAKSALNSVESIQKVAEQTGFGSSVNLIRAFKKTEGITPSAYRSQTHL